MVDVFVWYKYPDEKPVLPTGRKSMALWGFYTYKLNGTSGKESNVVTYCIGDEDRTYPRPVVSNVDRFEVTLLQWAYLPDNPS